LNHLQTLHHYKKEERKMKMKQEQKQMEQQEYPFNKYKRKSFQSKEYCNNDEKQ